MLERRSYRDIQLGTQEYELNCTASASSNQIEVERTLMLHDDEIASMDYKQARDLIDTMYGEWMIHVVHPCGEVLLYAAPEWAGDGPYALLEHPAYYQVPVYDKAQPIKCCPGCKAVPGCECGSLLRRRS
jgi:hypothetical protein